MAARTRHACCCRSGIARSTRLGGGQIISDAVEACGYSNVYAELRDAAPAVSLESIAARDPDVILVLAADAPTAQQWIEHWQSLPALRAVKNKRVVSFVDARLSRMGPEVVSATESLCTTLASGSPPNAEGGTARGLFPLLAVRQSTASKGLS